MDLQTGKPSEARLAAIKSKVLSTLSNSNDTNSGSNIKQLAKAEVPTRDAGSTTLHFATVSSLLVACTSPTASELLLAKPAIWFSSRKADPIQEGFWKKGCAIAFHVINPPRGTDTIRLAGRVLLFGITPGICEMPSALLVIEQYFFEWWDRWRHDQLHICHWTYFKTSKRYRVGVMTTQLTSDATVVH